MTDPADLELSPAEMRAMLHATTARVLDHLASTKRVLDAVNARGRVLLSGCTAEGRYLARVCILSFRTRQSSIDALVEDVAAALAET